jgi:hypothetical protein
MQAITTIGLDIAKSVFQVHGVDAKGDVVLRRQIKRRYFWRSSRSCHRAWSASKPVPRRAPLVARTASAWPHRSPDLAPPNRGALSAPTSMATPVPVEEPSTASIADIDFAVFSQSYLASRRCWRRRQRASSLRAVLRPVLFLEIDIGKSQSVCGGSPSSLSLAANAAIRRSASARVRLGLNASSS